MMSLINFTHVNQKGVIMKHSPVRVYSEIGKLKQVILYRPAKELENLVPDFLEELLFDDIPFLADAQEEHDQFANILRANNVEVLYLDQLVVEALEYANATEIFIDQWLEETGIKDKQAKRMIRKFLLSLGDTQAIVSKTIEGFKHAEIFPEGSSSERFSFLVNPMPNLYFTRDPFAAIGQGVAINRMYSKTRRRETLYAEMIFSYHPQFGNDKVPRYYDRAREASLEGGDLLVLSETVLAIGVSQRTELGAIQLLAETLFDDTTFRKIIIFEISSKRQFMHLDTVFTMVDVDKFVIHPEIERDLKLYIIEEKEAERVIEVTDKSIETLLAEVLNVSQVTLIRGGGGDEVVAAREQWSDGSNTLAIAPGEVIVYHRNVITNQKLIEAGIKLHILKGSELVRGRGGPRCMSMPIWRD